MEKSIGFAEKAGEAESLATMAAHPMIREFLKQVAKDYRLLAEQKSIRVLIPNSN